MAIIMLCTIESGITIRYRPADRGDRRSVVKKGESEASRQVVRCTGRPMTVGMK